MRIHQWQINQQLFLKYMKSRTKSTRENLTIDSKSRKISEQGSKMIKKNKKDEGETRKYLIKTLNLLHQNLKLGKVDKKSTNANLSASVYNIVKSNFNKIPKTVSKNNLQEYTSQLVINNLQNRPNEINKSTASLLNMSSINIKRRSNSTLDQYFKQKFGSPAKDEQTIEKKLRVLKALKKTQELVTKGNQCHQNRINNSLLQDLSEKNILIVEKIKGKKTK